MTRKLIPLVFILIYSMGLFAQVEDVPLGQWRDHLPYRSIKHIAETKDKIYAASDAGVLVVDIADNSSRRFSTIDGLSDVGVTALGASPEGNVVLIGYETGVMDIIVDGSIHHVYDIFRSNVIGDKSINHFMFYNERCYISTGFGIVEYDYNKQEVRETYLIGKNGAYTFVNRTHFFQDTLWAATKIGLYRAPFASFLYNPNNWSQDTTLPDSAKNYNIVSSVGNELMVNVNDPFFRKDTLYSRLNGKWGINPFRLGEDNNSIESYGDKVVISASTSVEVYNSDWSVIRREFTIDGTKNLVPLSAIYGNNDIIWIGDRSNGLIKNQGPFQNDEINLGGPASNASFNVFYDQKKVLLTGGGHSNWFPFGLAAEVSQLDETGFWTIFNENNIDSLKSVRDITSVSIDPNDDEHFFASSLNYGIFEFKNNQLINNYNQHNSILDTVSGGICFVSDVKYDENGNLWILNSLVDKPIVMLSSEGSWHSFLVLNNGNKFQTGRLTISTSGHLWVTSATGGLLVYNPGENLTSPLDDEFRVFTASPGNGNLPDNITNCAIEDQEDQMWIGTRLGLRVFYNSANVFSASFADAQDIFIQQDGQTQILLENENVTWMAIDGANRKWIATGGSGTFFMSSDGTNELGHFTVENSPLFSDNVNSLCINGKNGEVLMATGKGLIGYRGSATDGGKNFGDVYAFPNPVTADYSGLIAITGLVDGTNIKITDTAGNLVYETVSTGGQATWNGQTLNGNRASMGVYFVAASGNDGEEKAVTKILFLR